MTLRQLAFHKWYSCGQNLTQTVKELETDGYVITRQTIAAWRDEDNWKERAARLDAEIAGAQDALLLTEDEQLLAALKKQQDKYETYFDELDKPDPQATYAYNGLLKTIQETAQRTAGYKRAVFSEFFKDLLTFYRSINPETAAAIEEDFEAYMQHIKETI